MLAELMGSQLHRWGCEEVANTAELHTDPQNTKVALSKAKAFKRPGVPTHQKNCSTVYTVTASRHNNGTTMYMIIVDCG